MNPDIEKLVEYRLNQARETLSAARDLVKTGHLRDAVNRAYYSLFYASLGLLASRMLGTSKHTGVLSLFGQHFVKSGEFSPVAARYLREAFDLRQKCDYREFIQIEPAQVEELIQHAELFLSEAEQLWQKIRSQ